MLILKLPNEVIGYILGFLSVRDLNAVSSTCRIWRALAFPYLYRTVQISRDSHLASLASRVFLDNGQGPFSIIAYLEGLYIDDHAPCQADVIKQRSLLYLKVTIPRLRRLRYFHWGDLPFAPKPNDMKLFQMPNSTIEGVNFTITCGLRSQSGILLFFNS
jgi:hypothetical protein